MKQTYLHYQRRRRSARQVQLPTITLTPLIDTVLVLLIVFMVTSTGIRVAQEQESSKNIEQTAAAKPSESAPAVAKETEAVPEVKQEHNSVFVRVNGKGLLFINQERVLRKNFKTSLAQALKKLKEPLKIVLLKFEQGVSLALVQEIKRMVHQAEGIHGVYEVK
jgi:biopolymer transport protein ExbD